MNKPVIGIDLEGVLADVVERWLEIAKAEHGAEVSKGEIRGSLFDHDGLKQISYDTYQEMFRRLWQNWRTIRLEDPAAPSVLNRLKERFTIYIVTAALAEHDIIDSWLRLHALPFDRIVKTALGNKMLPEVGVYVDDFFPVLKDARANGKEGILFKQSWNVKHVDAAKGIGVHIASNWAEVEGILLGPLLCKD